MVAHKSAKERAKRRRRNEQLVRRSTSLTPGAKLLWLEFSAWAWDDPVCYPHQDLLALSLNVSRPTISRWLRELKNAGLLIANRQRRGNEYTLAEEIPFEVCDPARGFNSKLTATLRGHKKDDPDVSDVIHGNARRKKVAFTSEHSHVSDVIQDPPTLVSDVIRSNVSDVIHGIDEDVHRKMYKKKREVGVIEVKPELEKTTQAIEATSESFGENARSARKSEKATTPEAESQEDSLPDKPVAGSVGSTEDAQPNDLSELMEDPLPLTQHGKSSRKRRGPSAALVGLQGDGLRTASGGSEASKTIEASPPPPEQPEDVLALLRSEVEAKYGPKACSGMPLTLRKQDRGKVRNVILNTFSTKVVISMVRVLVWDWEVARSELFPPKTQVKIPTIEALVQYQEALAANVASGFEYKGTRRGARKTYAARYLVDPTASDEPF